MYGRPPAFCTSITGMTGASARDDAFDSAVAFRPNVPAAVVSPTGCLSATVLPSTLSVKASRAPSSTVARILPSGDSAE